ncbi:MULTISPECIES: universal stress protein [unclassified Pseudomonas]|uniref:universal stress protein n=1 Tax=unclassified Pseudomonas TaxID=196821 RepID=UPI00119B2AD4|nr:MULTISPECIES: universal stress protein [unclassified Pseudomonas]TWC11524.1 nucleotide-binding universal stress UspA family protein [Pseudomonas sp. SJZ083]TWC40022.1 nucleotide-binding universal stress UspA family protein [Pseudomonas sp. SJZ077]TWC44527.1 nucleotide-binding universal stress UspA family protein [Pseudomonas sp. SJZ080]
MTHVMACIDNSKFSLAVCDYAAWASQQLDAPLTLLHVLDEEKYPAAADLSGNIGLGSREHLLEELATLDAQRARIALEQGQHMLEASRERTVISGAGFPELKQRHGHLVESLSDLQEDIRLLVIGRVGEDSTRSTRTLGSQIEAVVRTIRRPILITANCYKKPEKVMLAFDGSPTAYKTVQMLAASRLCEGLPIHLVMVGADSESNREALEKARGMLLSSGFVVQAEIRQGEVEAALHVYQAEHGIDLLVMGAYGHSRIRQFLVGSTTTTMLRTANMPVLLLR